MDIHDPEYFRILRSLLPFLDFPVQKHFGIMLKLMELQNTMEYYQNPHYDEKPDSPEERSRKMLQSIRDACDPDKRSLFDMMLNAVRMQEMMQTVSSTAPPSHTAKNDWTDDLKKDLTPEQQGMFDMLSNMLGGVSL